MNRIRSAIAPLALVAALALGACGNEENNEYVDQVNTLREAYDEDVAELTSAPASSANAVAKTVSELSSLTAQLATDIEAVDPPDDVADLHGQLVDELDAVAEETGTLEEQLTGSNLQQGVEAATRLSKTLTRSQARIESLIGEINDQLGE